jgi:glutamyl-tRNA synthetase
VEIYEAFAKDMVARGNAYPCFCSEEELNRIRKEQEAANALPGYYGRWAKWRDATLEQVKAELEKGNRPVIRIRAPYPNEARTRFRDLIRGELDLPANDQDSVLVKSNSLPTYHFAHVVDDTLMRVNTIVRGEEWLPSAPLHIQTFEFLGLPLIDFAHVAPIAKMDGTSRRKLSKRKDPEADVMYYYAAGYPTQAVTEYMLNLANSGFYDWRKANPDAPALDYPFKLEEMGVAMPLFDIVKLNDISKDIIAAYDAPKVYQLVAEWAKEFNPRLLDVLTADKEYTIRVFSVERYTSAPRKDLVNWSDVERVYSFFFDALFDPQADGGYPLPNLDPTDISRILYHVRQFDPVTTPKEAWLEDMRGLAEGLGFARDAKTFKKNPGEYKGHFGDVMMVVRVALTGRTNTPDLYEILQIFGTERIGRRIEMALAFTNKP